MESDTELEYVMSLIKQARQKSSVDAKPSDTRFPNHKKIAVQIFGLQIDRALAMSCKPYNAFFLRIAGIGCRQA